ncbi:GL14868 [Drosophila persimilis]|uniref:GL14868 n=1 Tax=Drosophila persimilis TaxID=7234 RepID=B4H0E9_DROPE|nr:GL14868 [Drosophila persimilis]
MGSIANAKIVGYICRLCVQAHSIVIHLYSDRASALKLIEKLQFHLDLTISQEDIRPKVICLECFARIEEIHRLWQSERPAQDTEKVPQKDKEDTQKDGDDSSDAAPMAPNVSND